MDGPARRDTMGIRLPDAVRSGVYSSSDSEESDSSSDELESLTTGEAVPRNTVAQGSEGNWSITVGEAGGILAPSTVSERSVARWSAKMSKEVAER